MRKDSVPVPRGQMTIARRMMAQAKLSCKIKCSLGRIIPKKKSPLARKN
jgi:hypothetical protein